MKNALFPLRHCFDIWLWHVAGIKHPDFDYYYCSYTRPECIRGLFWSNLNEGWSEFEEEAYLAVTAYGNPRVRAL